MTVRLELVVIERDDIRARLREDRRNLDQLVRGVGQLDLENS